MELSGLKYVVVGAGFYGSVIAERIATQLNEKVLVIDKRKHIGGNSWSEIEPSTGVEVHKYGSHIFHTSEKKVWDYITSFSPFNNYRHRVLTKHKGTVYSMPINLMTINKFYGKNLTPEEARAFIKQEVSKYEVSNPQNFLEKGMSLIGKPLFDAFIAGYSAKQWQMDLSLLPASTISRLPLRFSYNDRYFDDLYEGIPVDGYGKVFERMLSHPNITIQLDTDYFAIKNKIPSDCLTIYTGPLDRYFNYQLGVLGWRTLKFEKENLSIEDFQGTTVMNEADQSVAFTRIHEFKHYHPERPNLPKTTIFREYSMTAGKEDDPYYPINGEMDKNLFAQYFELTKKEKNVLFGGRLGLYKYLDMHQVISMALAAFQSHISRKII